jgi:O-antigen ligase
VKQNLSATWLWWTFFGLLIWLLFTSWLPARICLSLFQAGIFVLVCRLLFIITRRNIHLRVHWAVFAMLALPCFGVLQLVAGTSVYLWKTAVATLELSALAATGWLSYQLSADADFRQAFQRLLVISGLIVSILSVLHWKTSIGLILWAWPNPWQLQATFPLLNHSHLAAFVEMAVAPAVWEAMRRKTAHQFYAWSAVVMACAIWAVGSRSGSVIVTCELAGATLLSIRQAPISPSVRRRAFAFGGAALFLIAGAGWQGIAARMSEPSRNDLLPIFTRATLRMVKERPWTGFGLGTWSTVYPAWEDTDVGLYVEHAHDDWLEWAAEGGIPFACVSLALAIFCLKRAVRQPWCLGIAAAFVQSIVEFPLHKPAIAAFQFAAIGCIAASGASANRAFVYVPGRNRKSAVTGIRSAL